MEGLGVREVSYSNALKGEDFRLEAEFYIANNAEFNSVKGLEIEEFSQYGTSKELNEEGKGFPILRLNEFDGFFISKPAKCCDLIDKETYLSLRLQKGDVLICRTNGNPKLVGKAAIVPKDYDYAFASYLYRIRPKTEIINAATLVVYLNSKYGRIEIEKYSMVGNQANFSPAKFRQISIPVFSKTFNLLIEEIVFKSFELSDESKTSYLKAENILYNELGIQEWQLSKAFYNVKTLKNSLLSSGRLDAEYYLPKYDDLFAKLSHLEYDRIANIANLNKSIEPGSDAYQESGIPFVRVADVTKYGISQSSIFLSPDEYDLESLKPRKDTILLSKDGSVGIAYKLDNDLDCITSGALLHLTIFNEEYLPDYLTLVLNSIVVQMQAERDAGGSIIQHWKPSEINNVIIPKLPMEKQIEIATTIQKSFSLRHESERLLNVAKNAVEIAINENEEKALKYLSDKTS